METLHSYSGPLNANWYDGLVGFWKLDEGTGTIAGTIVGTATTEHLKMVQHGSMENMEMLCILMESMIML